MSIIKGGTIGAGPAQKPVGTTAGTVAAGDDSRLVGVNVGSLDTPDRPLDGTELLPGRQSGLAVDLSPDDVAGNPVSAVMTHARNKIRSFTHLYGSSSTFSSSTTGAVFGTDPAEIWVNGTAAAVSQYGASLFLFGAAKLNTGTTPTGYAGITSTIGPIGLSAGPNPIDVRVAAAADVLPSALQDYDIYIGLLTAPSAAPTKGVFFTAGNGDTNWQCVTKNGTGGSETITDSGVAVTARALFTNLPTFRVAYDDVNEDTVFYIQGAEVGRHSTNLPVATSLYAGALIRKALGSTARALYVDAMSVEITESTSSAQYF